MTEKITREAVAGLLFECDLTCDLNKKLIKLCVEKKIFPDDEDSVLFYLVKYSKQLLQTDTVKTVEKLKSLSIENSVSGQDNEDDQQNQVAENHYIPNLLAIRWSLAHFDSSLTSF